MKMANGFSSSGREKGKGKGTGKKGACSNCGEIYHLNRDCPTDKQHSSWWNNQKSGKAGKDRGTWLDTGRSNFFDSWEISKGQGNEWHGHGKRQGWQGFI